MVSERLSVEPTWLFPRGSSPGDRNPRLQLAELLLKHYPDEKSEAQEHLNFAINEFREMKMQPALERALRHKQILGA